MTYIKGEYDLCFFMAIDLEAEERRLELLECFRVQRAILVEQINEVTKFLNNVDKRIAELERQRWGGASRAPWPRFRSGRADASRAPPGGKSS